jgi:glyoxylase-like metal-dependent hydrolase (beta-lactamase superfamily II)
MRGGWRDWFAVEQVEPGTWLVAEPGHVNCFLVEGGDQAVLVDTGLGLADIRAAAESLTGKPILAVNTHSHSDHRGGNRQFVDIAAHPLAADALTAPVPGEQLAANLTVAREQLAAYERLRFDDERFFHLFTASTRPRPLPPGTWTVPAGPPPKPLADRQWIELGGRALRTLATKLAGSVRALYPAHTLRYRVGPDLLGRAADAFEAVLGGSSSGRAGADPLGRPAQRHEFADFTVLRPAS